MRPLMIACLLLFPGAAAAQSGSNRAAVGVFAGPATFSADNGAARGVGAAIFAEAPLTRDWFVQAQYVAGPVDRVTVGLARAVAVLGPHTFLTLQGGAASVRLPGWSGGVYGGGGFQAALKNSRLTVAGEARLFVLAQHLGVEFLAGLKVHL